jgi:hypothetical protein
MTIQGLFPGLKSEHGWFDTPGYSAVIKTFGNVVMEASIGSYQGDTLVLLEKDGRLGFLVFGWGSCSGCDAMEACGSYEDLESLRSSLEGSIKWGTAAELAAYFGSKDFDVEWYTHESGGQEFIEKAKAYLNESQTTRA